MTVIVIYWNRLESIVLFSFVFLIGWLHSSPFVDLGLERSQVWNLPCLKILSRGNWKHWTVLSGIFNNAIYFKSLLRDVFTGVLSWFSEDNFLSLFLLLNHLFGHTMQFGKVYHPFTICKLRNIPLSFLLIPYRVMNYVLKLVWIQKNIDDCRIFLDFLLLIANSV